MNLGEIANDMLATLRDRGWDDADPLIARLRMYQHRADDAAALCEGMRYDRAIKYRDWPQYSAIDHREMIVMARWCRFLADLRVWELGDQRGTDRPLPPRMETGNPDELPTGRARRMILEAFDAYGVERPDLQALIDACKTAANDGESEAPRGYSRR